MNKADILTILDELIDVPVIECLEDQEFVDTAKTARADIAKAFDIIDEGKCQWDRIAALLGVDGDNIDAVFARVEAMTAAVMIDNRPSDHGIAQAHWEWCAEGPRWQAINPAQIWVPTRAREIDAALKQGE